jgi:hypothetical protein
LKHSSVRFSKRALSIHTVSKTFFPSTPDKLTGRGVIRYGVHGTAIRAIRSMCLKPEVMNVLPSLGAHFSCVATSLFVS